MTNSSAWQPIETAPKDGRHILIYGVAWAEVGPGSEEKPAILQASWDGRGRGSWVAAVQTYYWIDASPTHWMPLPEPPKTSNEKEPE